MYENIFTHTHIRHLSRHSRGACVCAILRFGAFRRDTHVVLNASVCAQACHAEIISDFEVSNEGFFSWGV